jgi:hypothetical protein
MIDFAALNRVLDFKADVIAVGLSRPVSRHIGIRTGCSNVPACRSFSTRMRSLPRQ